MPACLAICPKVALRPLYRNDIPATVHAQGKDEPEPGVDTDQVSEVKTDRDKLSRASNKPPSIRTGKVRELQDTVG